MSNPINQAMRECEQRAYRMFKFVTPIELKMDFESAEEQLHLDWQRLSTSQPPDFAHDVLSIVKHCNRETFPGTFPEWFCPRCGTRSKTQPATPHDLDQDSPSEG